MKWKEILRIMWPIIVLVIVLAVTLIGMFRFEEPRYSIPILVTGATIFVALIVYFTIVKAREERDNLISMFRITTIRVDESKKQITVVLELTLEGRVYYSSLSFHYDEE